MGWTFVWMMLILKIPIAMLFYIVWWAVKSPEDEPAADSGDGGVKGPKPSRDRRDPRFPRRRGPHGDHALIPPSPRTRTTVHARAEPAERH